MLLIEEVCEHDQVQLVQSLKGQIQMLKDLCMWLNRLRSVRLLPKKKIS
jgi:hypothetical protein